MKETHVIVLGGVYAWESKAPYVESGHSVLGALEYNEGDNRIKCHECGGWYRSLGKHVAETHGMRPREYRRDHGLKTSTSLSVPSVRDRHAETIC